ncbi:BOS complex subunit NOMO3-like [Lycodopsis pacificus]
MEVDSVFYTDHSGRASNPLLDQLPSYQSLLYRRKSSVAGPKRRNSTRARLGSSGSGKWGASTVGRNEEKQKSQMAQRPIRELPKTMAEKRRDETQRLEENRELSSFGQLKVSTRRCLRRLRDDVHEWLSSLKLWRGDIHMIEGMFGTGILSYFSFLRFLVMLNLIIFVLMFSFVMLPIIIAPSASGNITYNQNDGSVCSVYPSSARRGLVIFHEHITDLLSGGGFLEQTYLFYGYYKVDKIHFPKATYNLPLAYLLVTIAYLFLSLVWIVKRSATGFKRNLIQDEDRFQSFCNKIFAGWDFCITNENAVRLKRSSLLYELRVSGSFLFNKMFSGMCSEYNVNLNGTFLKVLPGNYDITAAHPSWTLEQSTTSVLVSNANAPADDHLVVGGYDASGEVRSDGEPMKEVTFLLYSATVKKEDVGGCNTSPVEGADPGDSSLVYLCSALSREDGIFVFPSLASGEYTVVPFYRGERITFDVAPSRMNFKVEHNSLKLEPIFRVMGFSVTGRVLNGVGGEGVPDATVSLNNQMRVVSKEDGSFRLENMTAGTYTIRVSKKLMLFEPITVKIAPNTPQLPDIITAGFSVCGQISISRLPEGMKQQGRYKVTLTHQGQDKASSKTIDSDPQGAFCFQAKPGDYSVHVSLPESEVKAGLALQPRALEVSLVDQPLTDLLFTQFMASVSGNVHCLASCDDPSVTLQPVSRPGERRTLALTGSSDVIGFSFDDVLPGKYKVSIPHEEWCWKHKSMEVEVLDSDVLGVEFRQIGYILRCSLSHAITLEFFQDGSKPENVGVYNLSKGVNRFCLSKPEGFVLSPVEGTQGGFKAFALAGVTFKIKSEDGLPLSGVLLSLSGGQFRSNLWTQDTGLLTFNNLSPGQYYFKPMMKEFRFEPVSQMITVEEGQNLSIDITGIKTAYSCYGAVQSLSGDAERDVAVEALGQGECSLYSEDTVTDEEGRFRLRGLLPSCKYLIQLRAEGNDHIERALPQHRAIESLQF